MTRRFLAVVAICLAAVSVPAAAAPVDPDAAAAARVVRAYFSHLAHRRYPAALRLRNNDMSLGAFRNAFRRYRTYHGWVGRPGPVDGAAGSLFVEVPVRVYGRLRNGRRFSERGTVTARRSNNVEGSTPAQRRWHIFRTDVQPHF